MLNEGFGIRVNAADGTGLVKFFHSRGRPRGLSRAGRWVGVALGMATLALGHRAWREFDRGAPHTPAIEAAGERHGRAHVADGDSVAIAGTRLRLLGIDAPELAQSCERDGRAYACGEAAKAALEAAIGGRPLDCVWDRRDKYGRGLARCRAGSVDLGAAMVREGWALAYGAHEAEEAEARRAGRGLWAGRFEPPEDFRRRERGGGARFVEEEAEW
jgi:endonuclease YncB( thermonuclease family)